jgi:hypothetical protein
VDAEGRTPFAVERLGTVVSAVQGLDLARMPALADVAAQEVGRAPAG